MTALVLEHCTQRGVRKGTGPETGPAKRVGPGGEPTIHLVPFTVPYHQEGETTSTDTHPPLDSIISHPRKT